MATATLDWSQCPAMKSVPGKRSGAWVLKDTRTPVSTIDEIMEWFDVTREKVVAVLEFAVRSVDAPPSVRQPAAQTGDLFDQGTPEPLSPFLRGHTITTAKDPGWGRAALR